MSAANPRTEMLLPALLALLGGFSAAKFAADRDLTIATYRVNLKNPLREIETDDGDILMHGKTP